MTEAQWRQGYNRLEERLAEWSARGWFPAEAVVEFRETWRLEQAQNLPAANEKWRQLYSLLLSTPMPRATSDERTIAQAAGTTNKALGVIMGWDRRSSSTDFEWNTDEAFADQAFNARRGSLDRRGRDTTKADATLASESDKWWWWHRWHNPADSWLLSRDHRRPRHHTAFRKRRVAGCQ